MKTSWPIDGPWPLFFHSCFLRAYEYFEREIDLFCPSFVPLLTFSRSKVETRVVSPSSPSRVTMRKESVKCLCHTLLCAILESYIQTVQRCDSFISNHHKDCLQGTRPLRRDPRFSWKNRPRPRRERLSRSTESKENLLLADAKSPLPPRHRHRDNPRKST